MNRLFIQLLLTVLGLPAFYLLWVLGLYGLAALGWIDSYEDALSMFWLVVDFLLYATYVIYVFNMKEKR